MRFQTSFLGTLTLATLATLSLSPRTAHATGVSEVSTTGKGAVGGALIGAEVVLAAEAAFDTKPTWAYVVGGVGGGIAGGIGGYFIERNANPRTTMLMLGAGMALAIPTTVAVLSATAYEPPANYTQDRAPVDEPVAEPPQPTAAPPAAPMTSPPPPGATSPTPPPAPTPTPSTSSVPRRQRAHRVAHLPPLDYHLSPPALFGISSQSLTLNIPAIELCDVYSRTELAMFGVSQATEVRVPVLNFVF
ncbi:MAG TPA: hypothetical protein VHV51_13900 [Polyangiaceae bacterium]|jgi:hypothetical protein|nr:hypothetical protein [Polyangiaceae bacterium]